MNMDDFVANIIEEVGKSLPSQAPFASVEGSRKDADGKVRRVSGTMSVCFLGNGFAEVIADGSSSSSLGQVTFILNANGRNGWFDTTPPQNGDIFTFEDGRKFAVTSVESVRGLYYRIGARQC